LFADTYVAGMSAAAAVACWRRKPAGLPFGLMASSGYIFLGLMDTLYNVQHGKYRRIRGPMALEAWINISTVVGGVVGARELWRTYEAWG
jgi:hypothetical protein